MSTAANAVLDAQQAALAAEQQAAFGYAVLGPRLPATDQGLARRAQAVHEDVRDRTAASIAAAGQTPTPPQGDYPALYPQAARPRELAARLEADCAAAWRFLYLQAASAPEATSVRRTAQQMLTASAVRATEWRIRAGAPKPVVPFPGIG
jgi:hypothetical protein